MKSCYKCKQPNGAGKSELRPYGPNGQDVCFACAFSSPDDKATTEAQFGTQLRLAGDTAILTPYGPKKHGARS